jgi:hypothetical protein
MFSPIVLSTLCWARVRFFFPSPPRRVYERNMAETAPDADVDSIIERLLEGFLNIYC